MIKLSSILMVNVIMLYSDVIIKNKDNNGFISLDKFLNFKQSNKKYYLKH
jgi:hypothetical protein